MAQLRILVAEGNVQEIRQRSAAATGMTPGEGYAAVLREILPTAHVDICMPADAGFPQKGSLDGYDGMAITGSSLNIHKMEAPSLRQIYFVREAFSRGIPMFGSCWGLQLATVAAGGEVASNPRGREVGFARRITLTEAGRVHPMHAGRAAVFDAPAIHADEVIRLPAGAVITAGNALSLVQAAEIHHGRGVFWGVQYHPEYRMRDVAAVIRRYGETLVREGFFPSLDRLESYASEVGSLEQTVGSSGAAWRLGLGDDVLREDVRVCEIRNWIQMLARTGHPCPAGGDRR